MPIILALLIYFLSGETTVFTSGEEGNKSYRIPAIIGLPNGDLLAFCEGRRNGSGDFGDINIVLKRSHDKGKSWGALQTVVDYDTLQAGNPAPVVDLLDPAYPKGRIFLFYNTGNNHEGEVRKGNGLREVFYITSTDGGASWSAPENITTQVHRPLQPQLNPAYNFKEDWRSYANTPGHAMQYTGGKFKGRIFVAANHTAGGPQPHFSDYKAHGFFTADHGKTFGLSEDVPVAGGNEAIAAPLSGNRLMFNARNQRGDRKERIVATSSDGGSTWDTAYFDPQLPDPVCQGSILPVGVKHGKTVLAFSNNADTVQRNNLTLRISEDEGLHWGRSFLIASAPKGKESSYSAYSDLVQTGKKEVGILYEKENYKKIVFVKVGY